MAYSSRVLHAIAAFPSSPFLSQHQPRPSSSSSLSPKLTSPIFKPCLLRRKMQHPSRATASSFQDAVGGAMALVQASPATWQSSLLSNLFIFLIGSPLLVTGLSLSGIAAAFLLGTLTWRAFGPSGFFLVATYFVIGTAATKVKMAQKTAQGIAEKRKGRRGPGSVIGSSAAGCVFAFLTIFRVGGEAYFRLWRLGFVASFCTKLSDTVSSEIGKAYGKTTYLVTTFKVVPRGTEGAVSVEGTLAGILASIVLAFVGCLIGQRTAHPLLSGIFCWCGEIYNIIVFGVWAAVLVGLREAIICVLASQIANLGESIIGASLQEKEGFQWLNNDAVNIINVSMGSITAVLMQQALQSLHS